MNKFIIGIAIVCFIAVLAGTADAAVPTRTKVKVKDFITKTATVAISRFSMPDGSFPAPVPPKHPIQKW
jgi:hypothetical protein